MKGSRGSSESDKVPLSVNKLEMSFGLALTGVSHRAVAIALVLSSVSVGSLHCNASDASILILILPQSADGPTDSIE